MRRSVKSILLVPAVAGALLAGGIVSASAVTAPPADLALAIPAGSGENNPLPLGTGVDGYFDAELRNLGPHNATGASLTVTLPAGTELGTDGVKLFTDAGAVNDPNATGTPLTCSSPPVAGRVAKPAKPAAAPAATTLSCPVAPVDLRGNTSNPQILEVDVLGSTGSNAAEPGTSGSFGLAITSNGDTNAANNTLSATIDFTGIADLTYTISPASPKAVVGHSTAVTLTVHNNGPQTAGNALAIAALAPDSHFSITGFQSTPPVTTARRMAARQSELKHLARTAKTSSVRTAAAQAMISNAATAGSQGVVWPIGDIASGGTATGTLTLTADSTGTSQVALFAVSDAADTGCLKGDPCTPGLDTLTATPQATTAYIASSRSHSTVFINALVKQAAPAGIVRSAGRTVFLQRYLNGGWQPVLIRTTDKAGQFTVGFVQPQPQIYRLYVAASSTAGATYSTAIIR